MRLFARLSLVLALAAMLAPAWAAHAYAQFGDIKYPAGFSHFDYVNPDAPKGGEIRMVPPTRPTNFDKFNPFTLKGTVNRSPFSGRHEATNSVIHGRPVRSLATNREPAGGG